MTMAEQLALAVIEARKGRAAALALKREGLLAQKNELSRAVNLPADAESLAEQKASLSQELGALNSRLVALNENGARLEETFGQKLEAAWSSLLSFCVNEIRRYEEAQIENTFYDALDAFKEELSQRGVELARATPAQLRQKLPELQMAAEDIRQSARQLVEAAAEKMAQAPEHFRQQREFEEKHQQVEREFEAVSARIRSHQHGDDLHLFRDIASGDVRAIRRLNREVLHPLLENARLERQRGLAGTDPLEQLGGL